MRNSRPWPRFVRTSITPLAPREPYCAVSAAFFRMVKLSMSAGYIDESVARSLDTPSMMTSGSLPPVSDVVPRTRTLDSMAMRSAPPVPTCTPAAWPERASRADVTRPLFMRSCVTSSVEPPWRRVRVESLACSRLVCAHSGVPRASPQARMIVFMVCLVCLRLKR